MRCAFTLMSILIGAIGSDIPHKKKDRRNSSSSHKEELNFHWLFSVQHAPQITCTSQLSVAFFKKGEITMTKEEVKELFEYVLIALACPLVLPFIDLHESED